MFKKSQTTAASPPSSLEEIVVRNDWYRDAYGRQLRTIIIQHCLMGLLVVAIIILLATDKPVQVVAITNDGRVYELQARDEAVLTKPAVAAWAEGLVRDAHTLNYLDVKKQLGSIQTRFTETAWIAFLAANENSKTITQIQTNRLLLSASVEPAEVIRTYTEAGVFCWEVEVPLTVSYGGVGDDNTNKVQKLRVNLVIQRTDMRVNPTYPILVRRYVSTII